MARLRRAHSRHVRRAPGVGADTIEIDGSGNNVALGDDGQVNRAAGTLAFISALTLDETDGGNDSITVGVTANGNNVLIGGAGADTLTVMGTGKNIVLGDVGRERGVVICAALLRGQCFLGDANARDDLFQARIVAAEIDRSKALEAKAPGDRKLRASMLAQRPAFAALTSSFGSSASACESVTSASGPMRRRTRSMTSPATSSTVS